MSSGGLPAETSYLLDTNILLMYMRGGPTGQEIENVYRLRERPYRPLICEVTIGEMLSLARQFDWASKKVQRMHGLLKEVVTVDISSQEVMNSYARIDDFCRRNGWSLGKNDVWIAASTVAADAHLLSMDKDFLPLMDRGILSGDLVQEKP
jgi:tRNA(fMet)-specific endonuclease VapC